MLSLEEKLIKLSYFKDSSLLLRTFFTALRISLAGNRYLIPIANPKHKAKKEDKDKIIKYVGLCLYLQRLLGIKITCLRSSLLLCNILRQSGINAQVNFGAQKDNGKMIGHCWVTVDNEKIDTDWQTIFKYPFMDHKVIAMETHDGAYHAWKDAGIKNKILVHLDAHSDISWIPFKDIHSIMNAKTLKEIKQLEGDPTPWDLTGKTLQERINEGNYIFQAVKDGIALEFYWVIPDYAWDPDKQLENFKKSFVNFPDIKSVESSIEEARVTGSIYGRKVTFCKLENLPEINEDVLLDIDLDYLFTIKEKDKPDSQKPWIKPEELADRLEKKSLRSNLITMSYSISGGFVPSEYRHFGDNLVIMLRDLL